MTDKARTASKARSSLATVADAQKVSENHALALYVNEIEPLKRRVALLEMSWVERLWARIRGRA